MKDKLTNEEEMTEIQDKITVLLQEYNCKITYDDAYGYNPVIEDKGTGMIVPVCNPWLKS